MANSANPEINKKIATSALGTLVIATVFFYLGDRYAETLVTYPGQIFDHLSDAMLTMWQTIKDAPFALDMTSNSLLFGGACFLIIWMIWLRYVAFIGNYRSGEESGSARWGTVKEGKKFKDLQTEDNNLLFTKNFGLALHRPKFDPEYDRNLNVLVVGGSGSGKTFNYVTPNICQLNTSYFVTDPKGTLLKDAGYLFTDNGYKLKSFNTINLDESMHYNPLKYVKTDTDILSFVNCFIMNTNPEGKSSGDPFWENAEKMLYTALIALLRDWFPAKDYNMSSLLTLLSLAEARENSCKETYDWMRDGLYLSNGDIASLSEVISENEDEVNTLVEKAASERAARYAYDHPKLPKGFVTIEQLQGDLDLGDLRDEVEDFDFDGDITEAFGETAEYKVDDNYHALLTWLPDHTEWLEEAEFDGLLEGCKGDIYKMVQMAQYVCFKSDLYDHCEDICRYGTLDQLRDMGVYAIRESLADEILNDLSYDEDYAPTE